MVRLDLIAFALAHVHGCIGMPHCVTCKHPDDAYNLWLAADAASPSRLVLVDGMLWHFCSTNCSIVSGTGIL